MKILFKKYGLIAVALLIVIVFAFQKCQINRLKDANDLQKVELSTLNDSVSVYTSKAGKLTYKLTSVEIERDNLKKSLDVAGFDIKELKERDVNWRKITSALKAELATAGSGTTTLHDTTFINNTDTIRAANFNWNNRYLFLSGSIIEKKLDFTYKYKTGIDIINTRQGKTNLVSVYLSDPNAVVITGNSISIRQKVSWYEKPWLWGVAGLIGGYFIAK